MNSARLTMTLPEFAVASGISKNLAYSLAKQDSLPVPVIKLGKRMVVSRRAVLALLDGNEKEAKDAVPDNGGDG